MDIVEMNGVKGRFTSVSAIRWSDPKTISSGVLNSIFMVVLEFSDMAGTVHTSGTTVLMMATNNALKGSFTLDIAPPVRSDIGFESRNFATRTSWSFMFISSKVTPRVFEAREVVQSNMA